MDRYPPLRHRPWFTASAAALTAFGSLVLGATPAAAAPGPVVLASSSATGVNSNRTDDEPGLSADGRVAAFPSAATNLVPGDTDEIEDIFVKNVVTGDIALASTSDSGVKSNRDSFRPVLSRDGTVVAFASTATNLDPLDTSTDTDTYVKNMTTGNITLATTTSSGQKSDRGGLRPALSADGRTVAFYSTSTNLSPADGDREPDIYVKDLDTGAVVLASTSDSGAKGNAASYDASLSADGTLVAFWSFATNLDPADTDPASDAYVKDLRTGQVTLVSASTGGRKGNAGSYFPVLSGDGTAVAFYSNATNLDPADGNSRSDVYVKDLGNGDLVLASRSTSGTGGNGNSVLPSLSADGTRVAFQSVATNLHPSDRDPTTDIYVSDLRAGSLRLASTSAADAKGNLASAAPILSSNGRRVVFLSLSTNLSAADSDGLRDVYVKAITG